MVKVEIEDNVSKVLDGFNEKEIVKAMRAGIRRTAATGKREIKQEYKKLGIKRNPKAKYDRAEKGIRGYAMKNAIDIKFSIMPKKKKSHTDGSFKLRWIEKGTKQRANEKGNRGTMPARPFFAPAMERIKGMILDSVEKEFIAALKKIKKQKTK